MASNPVTNADRKLHAPRYDDPDLARVRDVLGHYGNAAGFSMNCLLDLTILVKKARNGKDDNADSPRQRTLPDTSGERTALRATNS